jgi:hypothetical protein
LVLGLLGLLGATLTACDPGRPSSPTLEVELEVDPDPPQVGESRIQLRLREPDGSLLRDARVRIEGNMNHAGMVPEFADASETEPGTYVGVLTLSMAGDWYLIVSAEASGGRRWEETLPLPGVAPAREGG